jgi:hypothetical protein
MTDSTPRMRAQHCETSENVGRNESDNPTLGDVTNIVWTSNCIGLSERNFKRETREER